MARGGKCHRFAVGPVGRHRLDQGRRSWVRMRPMGFNPYRQHRRRPSDYVFVGAAFVVVCLLLLWAMIG